MTDILSVTFPFFALVLCGYVAARARLLPLDAVPGLNMFVLYFALPCMLYRFGSGTPLWQLFNPVVALLWLMCALLIITGVAWHARRRGAGWPDAAMGALVAAFPNSGFMGVPLILALLGQGGVGPVMGTLIIDLVVTTSLCIGLSQWGAADEHGAARAVGRALQGMLRNPMPWSILLGAAAGALGLQLWGPLGKTVQLLADAASPVALFTIGAVLARSQFQMVALANGRHGPRDVGVIAFTKLLVHPALVWGLGSLAVRGGWLVEAMLLPLVLAAGQVAKIAAWVAADPARNRV
ncbi:MAG: AEC family transporter, partial [Ottowia sp.]|nr:AEC family transporter [Ottowia sp.]